MCTKQKIRTKFNDKSEKFNFIDYGTNSKRYELYNTSNENIIINCDIEFDEERIWEWEILDEAYKLFFIF